MPDQQLQAVFEYKQERDIAIAGPPGPDFARDGIKDPVSLLDMTDFEDDGRRKISLLCGNLGRSSRP